MIVTKDITREEAATFLLNDRVLCERALPDHELDEIALSGQYKPFDTSNFIGMCNDGIVISITKWEYFTDATVNIHVYISSMLHGAGVTKDIQDIYKEWFATRTSFAKAVILAPGTCRQVHKSVELAEFKLEGLLTKAMIWRGELVDLHIYGYDLNALRGK